MDSKAEHGLPFNPERTKPLTLTAIKAADPVVRAVAPGFTRRVTPDQYLSLSDLAGRPVVLAFYPADWSPVCGDQMALYNEVLPEFHSHDAEILGISVDGAWCHAAFAKARSLHFPLLSDFEPKGAVASNTGPIGTAKGSANARCSSSIAKA